MERELSQMSLEELWNLFPIRLTEHCADWGEYYTEQEKNLTICLRECRVKRIAHIGSTSISNIWSKPIIDILVELAAGEDMEKAAKAIEEVGFLRMSSEEDRISFNLGYTKKGFARKVYHLHLRRAGDHAELYFRDYMNEHPEAAAAYERLKLGLWKQYEYDRDGYTRAKTDFVRTYTERAEELYRGRYEERKDEVSPLS